MCEHLNFLANVEVGRIESSKGGPMRFMADVRVQCVDCGIFFKFLGLPSGLDMKGACVSVGGDEARLAIAPPDQVGTLLDNNDDVGFTVRRNNAV